MIKGLSEILQFGDGQWGLLKSSNDFTGINQKNELSCATVSKRLSNYGKCLGSTVAMSSTRGKDRGI
jgi:hypothetical protein